MNLNQKSKINESPKPMIFFILGGPGAGKGTLCTKIVNEHDFQHFSTGELLRKELTENPDSTISRTIKVIISEGKLVSSDLLLDLLVKAIKELKDPQPMILLDGFPRNQENLEIWKRRRLDQEFDVKMAIHLECCASTMESNIIERAQTSSRDDDTAETIKKRIEVFEKQTKPLLELFERDRLLFVVDAEKSPEEIYSKVIQKMKEEEIL